jgi:hypothetical protein
MRFDSESERVAVRVGPTAFRHCCWLLKPLGAVFYGVALLIEDQDVMRIANGSLPALIAIDRSFASARW